jgi:hypothetical protein
VGKKRVKKTRRQKNPWYSLKLHSEDESSLRLPRAG